MTRATRASEIAISLSVYEVGSTTLFLLGGEAKQDAWLAMLLGAGAGLLLLLIYLLMYRLDSERDLFELCRHYLGSTFGWIAAFAFTAYFAYEASRNFRDIGELAVQTLLNRTPMPIIIFISIIIGSYVTYLGPRSAFRLSVVYAYIMAVGYALILVLLPMTGLLHAQFMFPVLEHGLTPVWRAAMPEIVSFPFGQTILFLVYFKYAQKGKHLGRLAIVSYLITAVFLTVMNQLVILVLGPEIAAIGTYPMFMVVQMMEVSNVIERADALFVLLLFMGIGMKANFFLIGAGIGLQRITGIRYKLWVIPLGITVFGLTYLSPTFTEYFRVGLKLTVDRLMPVTQVVIPGILFIAMLVRKKKRKPA
ncbi:spore germination protein KB [Paenibacillus rhizosphaerae]|uniref:Spore germination protein KB n=1 Tax=Paenibacillus rhizosphaerae TaxID=297318 RepID=A0A839TIV4_9BACL|nr:endospore germination permease [Paenibacillus rhizosphaerae]MBB3125690.1 spore germination protein KB [Paenibacillus rhizosphaerae]